MPELVCLTGLVTLLGCKFVGCEGTAGGPAAGITLQFIRKIKVSRQYSSGQVFMKTKFFAARNVISICDQLRKSSNLAAQ